MIILLSPSKTLDMDSPVDASKATTPALLKESERLIKQARTLSQTDIETLMKVSEKIASLNVDRFKQFTTPFTTDNAKPALYAFKGDVYDGLDATSLSDSDVAYAQDHLRMLSGLYGLLRPLDLMQAYRLEMGIKLANERGKNLYEFWGDLISEQINNALNTSQSECVVNLASNEYFSAVKANSLTKPIITPVFKQKKEEDYKVIGLYAKKARGRMSAYLIQNRIEKASDIPAFDWDGYQFNKALSDESTFTFTRDVA